MEPVLMRRPRALTVLVLLVGNIHAARADDIGLTAVGVGSTVPAKYPMYKNVGAELSFNADTGVHSFDGWGHRPDDGWDMMGFAYVKQGPGDFTLSLRVLSLPDCPYLNFGLTARPGLVGNEEMVFLKWNTSSQAWHWYTRHSPGSIEELNCPDGYRQCHTQGSRDTTAPLGLHIRLARRDGVFAAALSDDGANWKTLAGPTFRLPTEEVFLGVGMSCGNKGAARGIATFDDVRWSGASGGGDESPDAGAKVEPQTDVSGPMQSDSGGITGTGGQTTGGSGALGGAAGAPPDLDPPDGAGNEDAGPTSGCAVGPGRPGSPLGLLEVLWLLAILGTRWQRPLRR